MSNYKRHALKRHFAGQQRRNTWDKNRQSIIDCTDGLEYHEIFSGCNDGVYYDRLVKKCYVVIDGESYRYKSGDAMFPYYRDSDIAREMTKEEQDALLKISKTKFKTKRQDNLAYVIERNIESDKQWRDMRLRWHKALKECKRKENEK